MGFIFTDKGGTDNVGALTEHVLFTTDCAFDIGSDDGGATENRPRSIYLCTKLRIGDAPGSGLIQGHDSSVADANAGATLNLRGGNKTAGSGDGGDLNLDAGTSTGGTAGKINLGDNQTVVFGDGGTQDWTFKNEGNSEFRINNLGGDSGTYFTLNQEFGNDETLDTQMNFASGGVPLDQSGNGMDIGWSAFLASPAMAITTRQFSPPATSPKHDLVLERGFDNGDIRITANGVKFKDPITGIDNSDNDTVDAGDLGFRGGNKTIGDADGGELTLSGGSGNDNGRGGDVDITGGTGAGTRGGHLDLSAGIGAFNVPGGDLRLTSALGNSVDDGDIILSGLTTGNIELNPGTDLLIGGSQHVRGAINSVADASQPTTTILDGSDKAAGTGIGGTLLVRGGESQGGIGGVLLLQGGRTQDVDSDGGQVTIQGGIGGNTSGQGGDIILTGGTNASSSIRAGNVEINGGSKTNATGPAGDASLIGGLSNNTGRVPGIASVIGGAALIAGTEDGGDVNLGGGSSFGGTVGNVVVTVGNLNLTGGDLQVDGTQVVSNRVTGYTDPTGTTDRGTFATTTVTTADLAEFVKAMYEDLKAHGLIGN